MLFCSGKPVSRPRATQGKILARSSRSGKQPRLNKMGRKPNLTASKFISQACIADQPKTMDAELFVRTAAIT
jgi:hypothetical protein